MISLYDGQITDLLTNGARYNPEIRAMSWALLQEKQRIMEQALQTRTLAMIDSLPERILDILAVELRTPFYQQDFSIASKRELIKETLIYYTYMGTPEAVNRMLSAVFPGSYIEEWYTYGGQPYHFQVILEMSNYREAANAATIIKAVKKVKRLTAHLDGLVYQCNIGIVIGTHGQGYKYRSPWPGRTWAGTQPWRNKRGGHSPEALEIGADAQGFSYTDDPAGTKPKRSTLLRDTDGGMDILSERTAYGYKANATGKSESGTEPWRSAKGGHDEESVRLEAETQSFRYESTATGTEPKRSKSIKTEVAEVNVLSEGQAHGYKTNLAGKMESGTEPQRAQTFRQDDGELQVTSSSQGFTYTVQASGDEESGTEPQRRTKGGDLDGAFFTTADGQGYPYRIIMCGTAYCNNKRRRSLC